MTTHSQSPSLKAFGGFFDDLRFPVFFTLLLLLLFLFAYLLPYRLNYELRALTSLWSVSIAGFLGLNAFVEYGTLINIEGKRLSIVSECTSLSYILIFASAVIAYPASFKKKVSGLIGGISLIAFINLLRIVFLGWIGGHYPAYFDLIHGYLWEGGFLLVVLLLWVVWVNLNSLALLWERAGVRVPLLFLATTALFFLSEPYIRAIANLSNYLIHALNINGGVFRSDGNRLCIIFWGKAPWEVSTGIFYILTFISLCLLSFPLLKKGEERFYHGLFNIGMQTAIGAFALFLFQITSVVATYIILLHGGTAWKLTAISAALMVSPILAFGFLFKIFREVQTGNLKPETENIKPYLTEVI